MKSHFSDLGLKVHSRSGLEAWYKVAMNLLGYQTGEGHMTWYTKDRNDATSVIVPLGLSSLLEENWDRESAQERRAPIRTTLYGQLMSNASPAPLRFCTGQPLCCLFEPSKLHAKVFGVAWEQEICSVVSSVVAQSIWTAAVLQCLELIGRLHLKEAESTPYNWNIAVGCGVRCSVDDHGIDCIHVSWWPEKHPQCTASVCALQ